MDGRKTVCSLGRRSLGVKIRCLCSSLCSLGGRGERVVDGLGVPTGEIEVFVRAGHVGKLRFRHVKWGGLNYRRERLQYGEAGGSRRRGLAGVCGMDEEEVEDGR